jgi:dihydrolipoamide dehydrogenase
MSNIKDFDVLILGGGPGGYAAALNAAAGNLKVGLIEKEKVGGTCLHRGCIPAKELLETSSLFNKLSELKDFGINVNEVSFDYSQSHDRKSSVVDQLYKGLSGLLKGRKIEIIAGNGFVEKDGTITVTSQDSSKSQYKGRSTILAMGSSPKTLPGFTVDGLHIMTSDEILEYRKIPESVTVIGGGAIGCEFASLFSDLGSKVTILEVLPNLLNGCDSDVVTTLIRSFKKKNIAVMTGVTIVDQEIKDNNTVVKLADGTQVDSEIIILSVGRMPNTKDVIDPASGIDIDSKGYLIVDEFMRTSRENVYAIGDVVNTPQLAHIGFSEALVAVSKILGENPLPIDYSKVPWCIYSHPEVAFVGMTEAAAKEAGIEVAVKKDPYAGNSRAKIIGETDGMVKVIARRNPDGTLGEVLGVHMVGPWVTEQLGAGYFAVNWGAQVNDIMKLIQPHPTISESFGETVIALSGRGLHVV